jgi:hypothetical protein
MLNKRGVCALYLKAIAAAAGELKADRIAAETSG